jgi:fatty acid-binding protein DegV
MLSIKPVVTVHDGAVDEAGKVRTRSKALRFIIDRVPTGRVEQVAVLHAGAPEIDDFVEELRPRVAGAEIVVGQIGPVIGVHTGPRTIGIAWIEPD